MPDLILYSRKDCELCDKAEALFNDHVELGQWQLKKIDIDSSSELTERYGWSIPVLQRADSGEELKWPFPISRLRNFLL